MGYDDLQQRVVTKYRLQHIPRPDPSAIEGHISMFSKEESLVEEAHEYSEIHLVRNLRREDTCCEVEGVDEV